MFVEQGSQSGGDFGLKVFRRNLFLPPEHHLPLQHRLPPKNEMHTFIKKTPLYKGGVVTDARGMVVKEEK